MKTLYFDCSSGISGNMTLGALTEIVGDEKYLINELKKINLDEYHIEISKKVKNGITGTYIDVKTEHEHEHRNLDEVNKIIDNSCLDEKVKELAKKIFIRVAKAESKVHNKPLEEVHFHEVGAVNFNNMIPVRSNNYSLVDLNKKTLTIAELKYQKLLREQLDWLNANYKQVKNKSFKLYQLYNSGRLPENIKSRCCNFKLLEEKCVEYNK